MGTLGNVLVRGFLFFSSTYQNICYRRCSTKKIFLMEESFSIWEPSPCHPWSTTQIPNRWWSCLSLSSFSRCIWWKRPARINFDWLINILIGLDLATTTGSMVSLQLGLRREKQHTPCRNCTAEIAAPCFHCWWSQSGTLHFPLALISHNLRSFAFSAFSS